MEKKQKNSVVIYQAKSGAIELKGDFDKETLWATQAQIASAFDVNVRTVNEHIKNIYRSDELAEKSTIRNFRIVQKEGKRSIEREIKHYNLDLVISVGYRVNSKRATQFRQWATKTLRGHIVDGYTINRARVGKNYDAFMKAVADVRALLPAGMQSDTGSILELVRMFADTWMSLDAYDKEALDLKKPTKKKVALTGAQLSESVAILKKELMQKDQATDLFATERNKKALERGSWGMLCRRLLVLMCTQALNPKRLIFSTLSSRTTPLSMATNVRVPMLLSGSSVGPRFSILSALLPKHSRR